MKDARQARLLPWMLTTLMCVASVAALWPTWESLHMLWSNNEARYSHGYFVVLISAYLVYRQRHKLSDCVARPLLPALLPLVLLLGVWTIAVLASVQAIHQVLTPMIVWLMLIIVLGAQRAKMLFLPVMYLYLAIPIWESGNFVLQWLTVRAVGLALWIFQVPAYIEGNVVSLRAGTFEVAGGCSGLHYFVVSIAISVLYGTLFLRSARKRLLLVLAAICTALMTNWLRVFAVVHAGHLTDMQHYLVTHNHYYFGWVLFMIALVPYFQFARRVELAEPPLIEPITAHVPAVETSRGTAGAFAGCLLLLFAANAMIYERMSLDESLEVTMDVPVARGGWAYEAHTATTWRPFFVGATAEVASVYRNTLGAIDFYANVYYGQAQGREMIGYHNRIEGAGQWSRRGEGRRVVVLNARGDVWPVWEMVLVSPYGSERLLYVWYDVGGRAVAGDLQAKLLYGVNMLRGRPKAGVVVVSAICEPDCDAARGQLEDWLQKHLDELGAV